MDILYESCQTDRMMQLQSGAINKVLCYPLSKLFTFNILIIFMIWIVVTSPNLLDLSNLLALPFFIIITSSPVLIGGFLGRLICQHRSRNIELQINLALQKSVQLKRCKLKKANSLSKLGYPLRRQVQFSDGSVTKVACHFASDQEMDAFYWPVNKIAIPVEFFKLFN